MTAAETKTCTRCKAAKSCAEFSSDARFVDGKKTRCKVCDAEVSKEYRARRIAMKSKDDLYRSSYVKKCKSCEAMKAAREFDYSPINSDWLYPICVQCKREEDLTRREAPERRMEVREANLRKRFGISLSDYEEIVSLQGGGCAICGDARGADTASLAVDHDHSSGEVRGILCKICNAALGKFKDSRDLLDRAIEYLDLPPARRMKESASLREEAA